MPRISQQEIVRLIHSSEQSSIEPSQDVVSSKHHNQSELCWLESSGEAFAELAARTVIHCCQKCSIYLDFWTQLHVRNVSFNPEY